MEEFTPKKFSMEEKKISTPIKFENQDTEFNQIYNELNKLSSLELNEHSVYLQNFYDKLLDLENFQLIRCKENGIFDFKK
jgi:hypothetical protein